MAWIDDFVSQTRTAVFVRRADELLMIRPDKSMGLNTTATEILAALYGRDERKTLEVLEDLLAVRWQGLRLPELQVVLYRLERPAAN